VHCAIGLLTFLSLSPSLSRVAPSRSAHAHRGQGLGPGPCLAQGPGPGGDAEASAMLEDCWSWFEGEEATEAKELCCRQHRAATASTAVHGPARPSKARRQLGMRPMRREG